MDVSNERGYMSSSTVAPAPTPNRSYFSGWRIWAVYGIVLVGFCVLAIRLFNLQILQGDLWTADAINNRLKNLSDPAPRGIIYDRNGYILARNIASYNVVITPAFLPDDQSDIQDIYRQLSELTDVPVDQGTVDDAKKVSSCVPGPGIAQLVELGDSLAPYSPVRIKCNIDEKQAMIIRQKAVDWPGVDIEVEPVRDYPTGEMTANLIGFLGPIPANQVADYEKLGFVANRDKVGYAGVEASMQDTLAGKNGSRVVERDVAGQILRNVEAPVAPVPGNDVYLTIDARLQSAAEAALVGEINSWNTYYYGDTGQQRISSGVAIALNPKTGEVLAMVQWPSYENNRMARIIPAYYYNQLEQDPRHPMLNYAISGEYPPGSVFKLTTATGALNEGVVTLDQVIDAPGQITLCERFYENEPCTDNNQRPFRDWIFDTNPAGFGKIDFLHCIAYSSNVCFYKLGGGYKDEVPQGLESQRHAEYAHALGYGTQSGIELLGEAKGLIPTPQWKRINLGENWSTGDTYIASVGQGYVLATPLQVLQSAATIANNGVLMKPTVIRQVVDNEGKVVEKWFNPAEFSVSDKSTGEGAFQISPFVPKERWDITKDPIITDYTCVDLYCEATGKMKTVDPFVVKQVQTGMRMAVTEARGTLHRPETFMNYPIPVAGKTGTAEYCDDVARSQDRCKFGLWPTHGWTVAYAPYDDPEVVILAFMYNGGEGGIVAAPVVRLIMDAYFKIKAIDAGQSPGGGG
jgi:penicillin-binding protein 2